LDLLEELPTSEIPTAFWHVLRKETRVLRIDLLLLELSPVSEEQLHTLQQLLLRCQTLQQGTTTPGKSLLLFARTLFPHLLRATWRAHALATLVLLLGLLTGMTLFALSPGTEWYRPEGIDSFIKALKAGRIGEGARHLSPFVFAALVLFQNLRAALLAFVFGLTYGLGTLFILFYNGFLLGAYAGAAHHYGMAQKFWPMILPHCFVEVAAIAIAGGSGLLLARVLTSSRYKGNLSSIKPELLVGLLLLPGVLALLVMASFLEGFVSLNATLPVWHKWLIGLLAPTFFLWWTRSFWLSSR
jgi:uncharacterized membrane protein SpoIIM required for sporulation